MKPTIAVDLMKKKMYIKDQPVSLCFYDTAGTEKFAAMTDSYFRGAVVAIIMYDVTRRSTFTSCELWLTKLNSLVEENIVKIIIGNKTDISQEREIPCDEAERYARQNDCFFIETSCKNGDNVQKAINIVIHEGITDKMISSLKESMSGKIQPSKPILQENDDTGCC